MILSIGILGFVGVIICFILTLLGTDVKYAYWGAECVALTSMVLYTPIILIYEGHDQYKCVLEIAFSDIKARK